MSLTVIERAKHTRLTTVAAAKVELDVTGGADDAFLAALVDQASAAVANWCNRAFGVETVTEHMKLRAPKDAVLLSRWPLIEVDGATRNGQALEVAGTETDEIEGGTYRLDGAGDRIDWPSGEIAITYTAGYVLPEQSGRNLPHDIERAVLIVIKAGFFARARDPFVRSEAIEGAGATSYFAGPATQLPTEAEALLTPYRNLTFG